jgi:hypothetical protein
MKEPQATLICPGARVDVAIAKLTASCTLFAEEPALLARPYRIHAAVSASALTTFARAISGSGIAVNSINVREVEKIALELGCIEIAAKCGVAADEGDTRADRYLAHVIDCRDQIRALDNELADLKEKLAATLAELSKLRAGI